jgi:hypothetical protein
LRGSVGTTVRRRISLAIVEIWPRAGRLADGLARVRPWAGFVASVVMATFGLILITDNFHALSDFIYPLLYLPTQR